jgi:hypothetical protein
VANRLVRERMRRAYLRRHGKSSIELIEEAFYLLRAAAPATLAPISLAPCHPLPRYFSFART